MSSLADINATQCLGLFAVRNVILDFCSEEQASSIIGKVFKLTEVLEKEHGVRAVTDFELRYSCIENDIECLDIHILRSRKGDSLGSFRLYYRDERLEPLTQAEQSAIEKIPTTSTGLKIRNVTPERMFRMIANSKPVFARQSEKLASTILDAFMKASVGLDVSFQLDICKRQVVIHSFVGKTHIFRVNLLLNWFDKKEKVSNVDKEDYLFEPQCSRG